MKIKSERQYEQVLAMYDHYINVENGNEESAKAMKMQDALAAWEEYEEAMEYKYEGPGMYEYFDSEYDRDPRPSDADGGL